MCVCGGGGGVRWDGLSRHRYIPLTAAVCVCVCVCGGGVRWDGLSRHRYIPLTAEVCEVRVSGVFLRTSLALS